MVEKLEFLDAEANAAHKKQYKSFNCAPSGLKEITEAEFATSDFFIYCIKLVEYRQILNFKDYKYLGIKLFFFEDNKGYGLARDYETKKVRYFKFGCNHKWRVLSVAECRRRNIYHTARCYRVEECTRCKFVNAIDSSD